MLFVKFLVLGFLSGSLANLYSLSDLPKWAVYRLQALNIWELLFCWEGTT